MIDYTVATQMLISVTIGNQRLLYTLDYQLPSAGELANVKNTYGGYVCWLIGLTTYNATRQFCDVTNWIHRSDADVHLWRTGFEFED